MICPFITGERIYLACPLESDAETYRAWLADPEVRTGLFHRHPFSPGEIADYCRTVNSEPDREVVLAVRLRRGDRLIGNASLRNIRGIDRRAEFGIYIGDPASRGRGLGAEAARLMLDYAFNTLNLNRVFLHAAASNARAIRCYESAGFQREALLRSRRFVDGRFVDELVMAALRDDTASC